MSDEFLNGYHFVPRMEPDNKAWLEGEDEIERNLAAYEGKNPKPFGLTPGTITDGHAIYVPGRHSGRITCTVKLECPTVIGAKRYSSPDKPTSYAVVEPFLYKMKPAIPATSLKGLISSIAESASRSVWRALGDSVLTVAFAPGNKKPRTDWHYAVALSMKADPPAKGPKGRSPRDAIGTTHAYFQPASLPLAPTRSEISPADALFGYVRVNDEKQSSRKEHRTDTGLVAVAGKLRFSHAEPCGEWAARDHDDYFVPATDFDGEVYGDNRVGSGYVRLKELGEPMKKPQGLKGGRKFLTEDLRSATPTMYFKNILDPDRPISKEEFGTLPPSAFAAQGGKFYLHHVDADSGEPWRTSVPVQEDKTPAGEEGKAAAFRKSAVRPIRQGVTFRFHVDFDNLTDRELNLLCFALQPSSAFRHKIGMGKSVGLGSIEIVPESLQLVDRQARYAADAILDDSARAKQIQELQDIQDRAQTHREWLAKHDPAALNALLKIGEMHPFGKTLEQRSALKPVLWVPLAKGAFAGWKQGNAAGIAEGKSFQWFSNNEAAFGGSAQPQKLRPIPVDGPIPSLWPNKKPPFGAANQPTNAGNGSRGNREPRFKGKQMPIGVVARGKLRAQKADKTFRFLVPDDPDYADVFIAPREAGRLRDCPEGTAVEFKTVSGKKSVAANMIRIL